MDQSVSYNEVLEFILETLEQLKNDGELDERVALDAETPLIGKGGVIDSRTIVELLIALEEFIEDQYSANFDWTSDRAMSTKRSPFQTPTSLARFAVAESGR